MADEKCVQEPVEEHVDVHLPSHVLKGAVSIASFTFLKDGNMWLCSIIQCIVWQINCFLKYLEVLSIKKKNISYIGNIRTTTDCIDRTESIKSHKYTTQTFAYNIQTKVYLWKSISYMTTLCVRLFKQDSHLHFVLSPNYCYTHLHLVHSTLDCESIQAKTMYVRVNECLFCVQRAKLTWKPQCKKKKKHDQRYFFTT